MDTENLVSVRAPYFTESQGSPSTLGLSCKPEIVPQTVSDIVSEFPITLPANVCQRISRTHRMIAGFVVDIEINFL